MSILHESFSRKISELNSKLGGVLAKPRWYLGGMALAATLAFAGHAAVEFWRATHPRKIEQSVSEISNWLHANGDRNGAAKIERGPSNETAGRAGSSAP